MPDIQYKIGQKIQFLGDSAIHDEADHPCKGGKCVGKVIRPYNKDPRYTRVEWESTCEGHITVFPGALCGMTETVQTRLIAPLQA